MQIIYDGRKVQVWEFVFQGLNIGKWRHCDGVAVVKNVKTIMCQEGGTLPLISKQEHLGATSHHRSRWTKEPACRPGHSILVVYVRPAESEP